MTTGKTVALTIWSFVGKMMSLLFNTLSWFVIAFLPRSKRLLISWLQSLSAVILEPKKIKCVTLHFFPIYLPWSEGTGCYDLCFFNVEFQVSFFISSFRPHEGLFSSSSLSAIRVVSFAYLRLLMFLPAVLNPACESSSLAFWMMYSAYASCVYTSYICIHTVQFIHTPC